MPTAAGEGSVLHISAIGGSKQACIFVGVPEVGIDWYFCSIRGDRVLILGAAKLGHLLRVGDGDGKVPECT